MLYRILLTAFLMFLGLHMPASAQEKPLIIYCPMPENDCARLLAAFKDDTGIESRFIRIPTGEVLARLRAERNNTQADVWFGGPIDSYAQAASEGLLEPYRPKGIENIDARYIASDEYQFITWGLVTIAFVYNEDLLKEAGVPPPDSWESYADPRLRKNVVLPHPAGSGTAYFILAAMVQIYGEDETFRILKEVDKNVIHYTRSGAVGARIVATGEAALSMVFSVDLENLWIEGYQAGFAFPKEGTAYTMDSAALIKGARASHVDKAKALLDWLLTDKGQQAVAMTMRVPLLSQYTNQQARMKFDTVKMIDYDFAWAGENRARLLERYEREVRQGSEAK